MKCQTLAQLRPAASPDPLMTLIMAVVKRAEKDAKNGPASADARRWLEELREQAEERTGME